MADVFLSYGSADRARAEAVVKALENRGQTVWWDTRINAGETYDNVIETSLREARCCVVLWSTSSIQSRWVRSEANEADRRGILVPVLLDNVDPPLAFSLLQAASLVGWQRESSNPDFDRVTEAIARVLARAPSPASGAAGAASHRKSYASHARRSSLPQVALLWSKFLLIGIAGAIALLWIISFFKERSDAQRRRDKQEDSYLSFGFTQLRWPIDSYDEARITVFINSAPTLSGVRLEVAGTDVSSYLHADEGSPQSIALPLRLIASSSPIVTCLVVPDTYSAAKDRFAIVMQRFTTPPTKLAGKEFPKQGRPGVKSNLTLSQASCQPKQP